MFYHLKKNIKNYDLDNLKEELKLLGEKPFRAEQIFKWIYQDKVTSFDEMTSDDLKVLDKEAIQKVKTKNPQLPFPLGI